MNLKVSLGGTVMKKALSIGALILLFLVSFVLFLFLTFPYEVLKEQVAAELSQQTGYQVRIGDLSPRLPLGLEADNVQVAAPTGGAQVTLKSLTADVSVLSFLVGNLATDITVKAGSGQIDASLRFGMVDLARGVTVPNHVRLTSKNYPLEDAVAFGLSVAANAPGANPMVAPLLSAIGITGFLNGSMDFKLDAKNVAQSTGQAEITLSKAVLKLSNPALGLQDQTLKRALIKAKVENGSVVFDKGSGIVSDELELLTAGRIMLKPTPSASLLDLKVICRLHNGLKDKFGFVMDAMTGNATNDGQITMQVRGPMGQPSVTTF